jgi:hypothetical protein
VNHNRIGVSPNGWTDDFLCLKWFEKSFIPQATARNTSGKPILLIYDGHGSHNSAELIRLARANNIILFCLPPHTTHKLQPLDIGVFGPFQRAWIERCDEIIDETGEEMSRSVFVSEYMAVRQDSFKERTILQAWKKSGAWPIDHNVFTDEDFAPSIPYSTHARDLPAAFPSSNHAAPTDPDKSHPASDSDSDSSSDGDLDTNNNKRPTEPPMPPSLPTTMPIETPRQPIEPSVTSQQPVNAPHCPRQPPPLAEIPPHSFYGSETFDYITHLEKKVGFYKAHCTMLEMVNRDLKRKVNEKDNARSNKKHKVVTNPRMLTSDEGLRLVEEQEEEQRIKKQKKKEAVQRREDKAAESQQQRAHRDPHEPFRGSLTSKSKGDLQEIACVLGLSEDSTVKDLQARIVAHFDAHSHLRDAPLFTGLFNRTHTSRPNTTNLNNASTVTDTQPMLSESHRPALTTNLLNVLPQSLPGPSIYHHNPFFMSAQNHSSHHYYNPSFIPTAQFTDPSAAPINQDNVPQTM